MTSPARSPDLNPIENLWSKTAREGYRKGRQFSTGLDLEKAVIIAWNKLEITYLKKLVQSMPNRYFSVYQVRGKIQPMK